MSAQFTIDQVGKPAGLLGISRDDLDIGVIQLDCPSVHATYLWEIISEPDPGVESAATLATPTLSSSNFTVAVTGGYLVQLTVDAGLPTEESDCRYIGVPLAHSALPIPAAFETAQDNSKAPYDGFYGAERKITAYLKWVDTAIGTSGQDNWASSTEVEGTSRTLASTERYTVFVSESSVGWVESIVDDEPIGLGRGDINRMWIVPTGSVGISWATHDDEIAVWEDDGSDGEWVFYSPDEGDSYETLDTALVYEYAVATGWSSTGAFAGTPVLTLPSAPTVGDEIVFCVGRRSAPVDPIGNRPMELSVRLGATGSWNNCGVDVGTESAITGLTLGSIVHVVCVLDDGGAGVWNTMAAEGLWEPPDLLTSETIDTLLETYGSKLSRRQLYQSFETPYMFNPTYGPLAIQTLGVRAVANAVLSHAEGEDVTTNAQFAHAEGQLCTAAEPGGWSTGMGAISRWRGQWSRAAGQYTNTGIVGSAQHTLTPIWAELPSGVTELCLTPDGGCTVGDAQSNALILLEDPLVTADPRGMLLCEVYVIARELRGAGSYNNIGCAAWKVEFVLNQEIALSTPSWDLPTESLNITTLYRSSRAVTDNWHVDVNVITDVGPGVRAALQIIGYRTSLACTYVGELKTVELITPKTVTITVS